MLFAIFFKLSEMQSQNIPEVCLQHCRLVVQCIHTLLSRVSASAFVLLSVSPLRLHARLICATACVNKIMFIFHELKYVLN